MAIGSINANTYSLMQSYLNTGGTLTNYINGLGKNNSLFQIQQDSKDSLYNAPLYNSLGSIKSTADLLRSMTASMASISQLSSSVGKTASYSDKDILKASVANNAPVSTYTKTSVTVDKLAETQQNKSAVLSATDNSFGSQFTMSVTNNKGQTSAFNVNLSGTDNNKTAMQSMADKINSSDIGVKATVSYDEGAGTVSLVLEGKKTGTDDGKFTVTDGSAANLSVVDRSSSNAEYSVNGKALTSQSNDNAKITDGVTATLNKTGTTQITYAPDSSGAVSKVQSFVDTFNSLKDKAASSGELNAQMLVLTSTFAKALDFSGIGVNSKGKLEIKNEETLKNSISSGSFAKNFQGVGSFGDKLNKLTTSAYKTAYSSAVKDQFQSFMKAQQNSSNSLFSNLLNDMYSGSGLLFNGWA